MKKNLIWWGLTIIWCAFIFYMSSRTGDQSSLDSGWVSWALGSLLEFVTKRQDVQIPALLIRKAAHFFEYFVLGFLLYKSFHICSQPKARILRPAAAGIFYALTDEIHQFFVPGRAMQLTDVGIDALGVISAICIFHYFSGINTEGKKSA